MAKQPTHDGTEYRLLITPQFNERGQKYTTLFLLETVKAFASFQYELSVEEAIDKKNIKFKVRGLKTPHLSLPATGHAQFRREMDDLKGTYAVSIEGIDGRVNSFNVRITPQQVKVVSAPVQSFVRVVTGSTTSSDK